MKIDFCSNQRSFGKTVNDIKGFASAHRFIILSEITSNTIPNIIDIFFGLGVGGTNFVNNDEPYTRVMVVNQSEVYGTYYDLRDARTRNVFIHYGMAKTNINRMQGDTPIIFTDVDWGIIEDCPEAKEIGKKNGRKYDDFSEVDVSYDSNEEKEVFRKDSGKTILIPSPLYYDEKDMVLLGNIEESYYDNVMYSKEALYTMPEEKYLGSLFKTTLNELMDNHTVVYKLNITVDNLSSRVTTSDHEFSDLIQDVSANVKYHLEKYGFSSCEVIFAGSKGFNLSNLKSYMNLSNVEKQMNYMCLIQELQMINEDQLREDLDAYDCSISLIFNYSNVSVKIVDRYPERRGIFKTDSNVLDLSNKLKIDNLQQYYL
jgi:hypothetical protein